MSTPDNALLLSCHRALLGAVFPQLRAVLVRTTDKAWHVRFLVDGEIAEDDHDSLTTAAAEIAADLPTGFEVHDQIERLDAPAPMAFQDWRIAFLRKEPLR